MGNVHTSDVSFSFRINNQKEVQLHIGINSSKILLTLLGEINPDKVFIICDRNVARLYADQVSETVSKKFPAHIIIHSPGETSKNLVTIREISEEFFLHEGTSNSAVVALGGGVTGNIAGFFASIVFRGIKLMHIPTTLLAQLDSAADVKQSVNSTTFKNAIGSYKAPDAVIIDPLFLKTLGDREIRAGLSEAAKHGLAQDLEFVNYLLACDIRSLDDLQKIITKVIKLKIEHWESTPAIWNDSLKTERLTHLGHTTGKILEMIDRNYLTHGEAIAHGMVIEAYISHILGHIDLGSVMKIYEILLVLELLYPLSDKYNPDYVTNQLYHGNNKPIFALLVELGNPQTISTTVPKKVYLRAARWYFSQLLMAKH
jgi:3-dehydroquinate synthetase